LNSMGSVGLSMDQVTNFSVKIRILESSYTKLAQESGHSPFRPGMSATVEIATETVRDVLSIPIKAVTTRQDTSAKATRFGKKELDEDQEPYQVVFVESGGRAQIRVVKTGIQDTKYKQVLSGLQQEDIVITGPYDQVSKTLKTGQMVETKEKEKAEK
jgi:HlyD family secretion protein